MKNALIFGSSGQDAFYLKKILIKNNITVTSISRTSGDIQGSVGDFNFVCKILKSIKPDFIFHLAAISSTSNDFIHHNYSAIISGTFNILECTRTLKLNSKIFLSGSALQFKKTNQPINESSPMAENNFYELARIQSLKICRYYRKEHKIQTYFGYFFNHDSPIRKDNFFNQKIINLAKICNKKSSKKINLGDLSYKKEFAYAEDIMNAVWVFLNQDSNFELVIGTGKAYSLKDWVELCFKKVEKNFEDYIEYSLDKTENCLVSDPSLLKSFGWEPAHDINDLVNIMLNKKL